MSATEISQVFALPDDVLQVIGTVRGEPVIAWGWQSVFTNHYDDSSLCADGHRKDDAEPRTMVKAEKLDYCRSLLEAAADARPKPLSL